MCKSTDPVSPSPKRLSVALRSPLVNSPANQHMHCHVDISNLPKLPLHQECSETVSAHSSSDLSSSSSIDYNSLYPITGYRSNILDDYYVAPVILGKGHYGCVRECIHRFTRQTFAVKTIQKSKVGRIDHLRREVSLLNQVDHPGVMRMVDCYEDEDYLHIVTEKYTGGELFDKIVSNTTQQGCLSEVKASIIIKSLLEAVQYLHENGIVHRDIKPENILFENNNEDSPIKLIDFGLSRRYQKGDMPMSSTLGTAYYMSPEILKGSYGEATDIWSIGVVAYILICGFPPFNGESDMKIAEAIMKGRFNFVGHAWTGVSEEVKDFIKCLLRRDPRKRYTAEEALQHPWIRKYTQCQHAYF